MRRVRLMAVVTATALGILVGVPAHAEDVQVRTGPEEDDCYYIEIHNPRPGVYYAHLHGRYCAPQ